MVAQKKKTPRSTTSQCPMGVLPGTGASWSAWAWAWAAGGGHLGSGRSLVGVSSLCAHVGRGRELVGAPNQGPNPTMGAPPWRPKHFPRPPPNTTALGVSSDRNLAGGPRMLRPQQGVEPEGLQHLVRACEKSRNLNGSLEHHQLPTITLLEINLKIRKRIVELHAFKKGNRSPVSTVRRNPQTTKARAIHGGRRGLLCTVSQSCGGTRG